MLEKIETDLHKNAVTEHKDLYEKDLSVKCECSLEEFYEGSTKQFEYERVEVLPGGVQTQTVKVQKEIVVKPGMKPGMQIRFPGEGNSCSGKRAGDLVVTITEVAHPSIRRDGDNLIYRHKIDLCDALSMQVVEFKTLDGEIIRFRPD